MMYRIGYALAPAPRAFGVVSLTPVHAQQAAPGQPGDVQVFVSFDNSSLNASWTTPVGSALPTAHRLDFRVTPARLWPAPGMAGGSFVPLCKPGAVDGA